MIKSINPATLELIGEVEETPVDKLEEIYKKAREAQKKWAKISISERAQKIIKVNEVISTQFDEISLLISNEVGKPPAEAFVSEVYGVADSTFYYYNNVADILGGEKEVSLGFYESLDKHSIIMRKPIGVVCVIGPYNYPFTIPFQQIVQSLLAGNSVVFKPSSETVLVGQKIQEIFEKIDIPKDLVQTVFGSGSKLGNPLIDFADKVIFTGSTATGKRIMQRGANTLTEVSLELGGKSAMVVFPDANIERAILAARWGVFTNAGQVCASVKRLYLHEEIYDYFLERLVILTKELKQDIPTKPNVDVGAMINKEQLDWVHKAVQEGIDEGAKILIGGKRNPNLKGYFYEPTIIEANDNKMKIVQEEIFGPVLVVLKFDDTENVINMVNDNQYGLTSSVWTNNIDFGKKVAEEIDTGSVMVNEVVYTFALAATPWGGTKNSGIGRSHGKLGFYDVTRPLHINIDKYKEPDLWWMPYDEDYDEIIENFKNIASSLVVKNPK
ncbi:MAG: aldehyde dehydrogenase family protein [Candidatus Lokiarchaeota archaeon]|nr:aldehyde dehydrogenase family protein [Candidatus Lokiarchaeota archaeon]MBD3201919.1 aldehyde dehydrogenase family protein [Candidatus Lokiarchaeota archaeon]